MSRQADWGALRLLIVGGKIHTAQTLRTVLGIVGIRDVTIATDSAAALELLRNQKYAAVFCDDNAAPIKQMPFSRAARHSSGVINPMIPIFLVSSTPRRRLIEAERDRGISDVIARPVSAATIMRKLRLVMENPRSFIKAGEYFGPDRRGETRPPFKGNDRRDRAARKVKVNAREARDIAADETDATYI